MLCSLLIDLIRSWTVGASQLIHSSDEAAVPAVCWHVQAQLSPPSADRIYRSLNWNKGLYCFSFIFPLNLSYRCYCPPQLEGPSCQQTRLGFLGNGYAWFPPIRPCFDSHLSLEFMTEEDDGLLLYAGPLATLLPGEGEDYMAIGKDCG